MRWASAYTIFRDGDREAVRQPSPALLPTTSSVLLHKLPRSTGLGR